MAENTGIGAVIKLFGRQPGQSLADFKAEWDGLTETDKEQLKNGINDGSMNY